MRIERKKNCVRILAALLLAALLLAVPPVRAEQQEGDELPEWTVMFYLCGSDLESKHSYATGNLTEILSCYPYNAVRQAIQGKTESVSTEARCPVNVVIQTGGCKAWHAQEIGMDIASDRLQRWHFQPTDQISLTDENTMEMVAELPLASMSKPETLADFIRWSAENYPAKKYALVLWDHGGGAKTGILIDELFDGDILYLDELRQAMADGGVVFETVLFDACLMANLETACAIQPYARWMVASEENVAGKGTAIGGWLQQLYYIPQWNGERLGRWICDMTQKKYADAEDEQIRNTLTWSVIDLSKIPRVAEHFDTFFEWVGKAYAEDPDTMLKVASYLSGIFEFGLGGDSMKDLSELVYQDFAAGGIDPVIYSNLMDALMDAVVYNTRSTGRSKAHGLSFFCYDDNTAAELENYSRNCPSPHYLAFLDAITPEWHAPEEIYDRAERLPGIDELETYRLEVEKVTGPDGTPGVRIVDGYANLRYVRGYLSRVNPDTGNILDMGGTIALPVFTEDNRMHFALSNFWNWPAIEGVHCCAYLISRYMMMDTFNIPVRVGGDQHILRCGMNIESNELTIYGLWEGYDTDSNLFNRTVKSLPEVAGQEYTLLYPIIDSDVDRGIQYEASAPMTMYRALEIKPKVLPAGTYYLDYWVEDMFTHQLHVGIAGLNWDGEKISMLPDEQWEGVMTLDLPAE